jgi:hypothetical protein
MICVTTCAGLSPDRVAASVDAIVRYVETNQERAAE